MKRVKEFVRGFIGLLCVVVYIAVFYWLMYRALLPPVNDADHFHPHYSIVAIIEWVLWICLAGGIGFAIRFGGEND